MQSVSGLRARNVLYLHDQQHRNEDQPCKEQMPVSCECAILVKLEALLSALAAVVLVYTLLHMSLQGASHDRCDHRDARDPECDMPNLRFQLKRGSYFSDLSKSM